MERPNVILVMAMSLDGYITNRADGLVDWTSKEDKKHFVAITKEAGAVICGRKTFALYEKPLPGRLNVVMTRTPDLEKNIPGELEFTNQDPETVLKNLAERGYKTVALTGGADINSLFLGSGLVDELYITIEPLIFGSGKRLATDINKIFRLELVDNKMLNEHTVLLHYKVRR
jgi:dihydrofolate reductase